MPTISAILPEPLLAALDQGAAAEGKSRSAAVAAAVERWCEARGVWPADSARGDLIEVLRVVMAHGWMKENAASAEVPRVLVDVMEKHSIDLSEVSGG